MRLILKNNARIGIINRGEAAMRFIRTLHEYNIMHETAFESVVFYVEEERSSLFVQSATESFPLTKFGVLTATDTPYLMHELLINALLSSKCDAVWAGWGFVSEDATFVEQLEKQKIIFLGPSSLSMSLLGDKINSKALADKCSVAITPWSKTPILSLEHAQEESKALGYPVIFKASNAGGGRGIRFVWMEQDLEAAYYSTKEETKRITGQEIFFIERLVSKARHFEVQALGDYHGNIKTFGVRDCSIQRKNQKIIEETPPVHISKEILIEMESAATRLLKEAHYEGAGTVEFIYDIERESVYFMEVNARLQVEHPITEELYQIDLVSMQIDIARGMSIAEYNYTPYGHVMELRLNAEDAAQNFKPAPGYVSYFKPATGLGVRVDTGITTGSVIPSQFDSMVAKIIVKAHNRSQAIGRLKRAVEETFIAIKGGTTNRLFALELLNHPQVVRGGVSTRFVEDLLIDYRPSEVCILEALLVIATQMYMSSENISIQKFIQDVRILGQPREITAMGSQSIALTHKGCKYSLEINSLSSTLFMVRYKNYQYVYTYKEEGHQRSVLVLNGKTKVAQTSFSGTLWRIEIDNGVYLIDSGSHGTVTATSTGVILRTKVRIGDVVQSGDLLLQMEAMKMEIPLYASISGVVRDIMVDIGAQVSSGTVLMKIDENLSYEAPENTDSIKIFDSVETSTPSLTDEVLAFIYGYDVKIDFKNKELVSIDILAMILPYYTALSQIFSHELTSDEGSSSYKETFMHLLRGASLSETSPKMQSLIEEIAHLYDVAHYKVSYDTFLLLGHRIYTAYSKKEQQERLLQHLLINIKNIHVERYRYLVNWLLKIVSMKNNLSVLAQEFIYYHFTKYDLALLANDKVIRFQRVLDLIIQHKRHKDQLMKLAMNYGPASELELYVRMQDSSYSQLAMEVLLKKLFWGRELEIEQHNSYIIKFRYIDYDENLITSALVLYSEETRTQLVVEKEINVQHLLIVCYIDKCSEDVLLNIVRPYSKILRVTLITQNSKDLCLNYRHYVRHEESLVIDERYQDINPFHFYQLKLFRLSLFKIEHQRLSSTMGLILAQARDNPKDERFILYMSIEALRPLMNERVHLLGLEESLSEAIFALRQVQLQRKKRLYWNRLLIFVQEPMDLLLEEVTHYSMDLAQKLIDTELGIERICVYVNYVHREPEEITLTPSGSLHQMTLTSRRPKNEPLKLQNTYDIKVMQAHARGVFYPYALLKLLKNGDFGMPKASFIEYDLVQENDFSLQIVTRDVAQNKANIVFGIIEQEVNGISYKRVLLLSDPTQDMGSLSEPESRRIIAALNMAEEMSIPVEWLPLSSGAKITMDSGTENLDWTAATLRRIIEFTQSGGEINIIVSGVNVGAQSYWNAEATMLMHTRGLLIMTDNGSMLLTGKRALDFAGVVSASDNLGIGGAKAIMLPNGEAQIYAATLKEAYQILLRHYQLFYPQKNGMVAVFPTSDCAERDISFTAYEDNLGCGFTKIGDIFSHIHNSERKKPFSMRQVMRSVCDVDAEILERMAFMANAQGVIVWQSRIGGYACGVVGIESYTQTRHGQFSSDGPSSFSGGTLYPMGSNKLARAINIFSNRLPLIILANLSGFDGSPESLRLRQLEWGAEIGRAVVNFKGPILFVVVSRYHGGAYVVFSKSLNSNLTVYALDGSFASVIGGAPAAAVVFPAMVAKRTFSDSRWQEAQKEHLNANDVQALYQEIYLEKQQELASEFDKIHNIERAKAVGSVDEIVDLPHLRLKIVDFLFKHYTS